MSYEKLGQLKDPLVNTAREISKKLGNPNADWDETMDLVMGILPVMPPVNPQESTIYDTREVRDGL